MKRLNLHPLQKVSEDAQKALTSFTPRDIDQEISPLRLSASSTCGQTTEFFNFDSLESLRCGAAEMRNELLGLNLRVYRIMRLEKRVCQQLQLLRSLLRPLLCQLPGELSCPLLRVMHPLRAASAPYNPPPSELNRPNKTERPKLQ